MADTVLVTGVSGFGLSRAGGFSTHTRRRSHVGAITATPYWEAAAAIRLS